MKMNWGPFFFYFWKWPKFVLGLQFWEFFCKKSGKWAPISLRTCPGRQKPTVRHWLRFLTTYLSYSYFWYYCILWEGWCSHKMKWEAYKVSWEVWQHTLATAISGTTVYSEKVDVPMKWNTSLPLHMNLGVPSGITPWPWVLLKKKKKSTQGISIYNV